MGASIPARLATVVGGLSIAGIVAVIALILHFQPHFATSPPGVPPSVLSGPTAASGPSLDLLIGFAILVVGTGVALVCTLVGFLMGRLTQQGCCGCKSESGTAETSKARLEQREVAK